MRKSLSPQALKLLAYLLKHQHVTPLKALDRLGIYRLSARILELRQSGYRIDTRLVKRGKAHVADYWLERAA